MKRPKRDYDRTLHGLQDLQKDLANCADTEFLAIALEAVDEKLERDYPEIRPGVPHLCPFCDGTSRAQQDAENRRKWAVVCSRCYATGPLCDSKADAARGWNRRTQ